MADTGAPWNIPYVENADLVKDYPTASLALANAIVAGLDDAAVAGIGTNAQQTVLTTAFSVASTSYTDLTGLTVTITPTSASSRIAVFFTVVLSVGTGGNVANMRLRRGSTDIFVNTDSTVAIERSTMSVIPTNSYGLFSNSGVYIDSPATTSPVTYGFQVASPATTIYVNRRGDSTNTGTVSHITAIEVKA